MSAREEDNPDRFSVIERSVRQLAEARGISSMVDCRTANKSRQDRRVYRLGDALVAKLYAPEARDRYERERTFFELNIGSARRPDLIEATFHAETGGYIVMTRLSGDALSDIHQDLTATDYVGLAADLGACIAAIHAVPLTSFLHLPSSLQAERKRQFDLFPGVLDRLRLAQILPENAIPSLIEAFEEGRRHAFASPQRLIHGDVSRWNVFVCRRDGRWSCALIDFEESAPGHLELDFVSPFVFVLDEAFPGRRLAASWDRIWRSFVGGYASIAKLEPNVEAIVAHALAWCLWASAECLDTGNPRCRKIAGIALDAFATIDGRRFFTAV